MNRRFTGPSVLATLLMASLCGSSAAQVTFRGFGVRDAYINDMSADGSVVVGMFVDSVRGTTAFRWTAVGGLEEIGGLMDEVHISRDGNTIVGAALDSQGVQSTAIWMGGKNWRTLGGVPGGVPGSGGTNGKPRLSSPRGVSGDGSVIVGSANVANSQFHGFRWDAMNGMVDLGTMIQGDSSQATGVSANGKDIIGWTDDPSTGYRLGSERPGVVFYGGIARLIHPYGWVGTPTAVNDVGSTVVGRGHPANTGALRTYRWNAWDGSIDDLGAVQTVPPVASEYTSQPFGLSDTGDVVAGVTGSFLRRASIWTRATGMLTVADYLTANGVTTHTGWDMRLANYVSPDGKRIAGTGFNPQMFAESWIVTLP